MTEPKIIALSIHGATGSSPTTFQKAAADLKLEFSYQSPFVLGKRDFSRDIVIYRCGDTNDLSLIKKAIDIYKDIDAATKADSSEGLLLCSDKIAQTLHAQKNCILMPKTILLDKNSVLLQKEISFPIILKKSCDFGGQGVFKAESETDLKEILSSNFMDDEKIIIQEFIGTKPVQDLRTYVIGDTCTKGIVRTAKEGEFRANTKQGSTFEQFALSEKLSLLSLEIAKIFKMEMVAIDFIDKDGHYYFLEINDTFGLNKDISLGKDIISYLLSKYKGSKK